MRVTFLHVMTKDDVERFAASVTTAMPTLRLLALSAGRVLKQHGDEWYDDVYDLNTSHTDERWWRVVKEGYGRYPRDMTADDGETIWKRLIDEDDINLDEEEAIAVDDETVCE